MRRANVVKKEDEKSNSKESKHEERTQKIKKKTK